MIWENAWTYITQFFLGWDYWWFANINRIWVCDWADQFFPRVTDLHKNHYFVIGLALFTVVWVVRDGKQALKGLLVIILAVGMSDVVAYRLVKSVVHRDRPEFNPAVSALVRVEHQTGPSFPSNHTANMFAAATIINLVAPGFGIIAFIFAFIIGYSRIYVGVHFPSDVFFGALLGYLMARLTWNFFSHWALYVEQEEVSGRSHIKKWRRTRKNPVGD